jgi:hypothetical protein
MSLQYSIPKTSIYLQTANIFTASFNVPVPGFYDFNIPANQNRNVLQMDKNAVYLINKITIGGSIAQESYLQNMVVVPSIVLKYSTEFQRVYNLSIPVVQYVDGLEAVAWFWTEKLNEMLTMTIDTGRLSQDAILIGVPSVSLNVTLSIFEIKDNGFIQSFKSDNHETVVGKNSNLKMSDLVFVKE